MAEVILQLECVGLILLVVDASALSDRPGIHAAVSNISSIAAPSTSDSVAIKPFLQPLPRSTACVFAGSKIFSDGRLNPFADYRFGTWECWCAPRSSRSTSSRIGHESKRALESRLVRLHTGNPGVIHPIDRFVGDAVVVTSLLEIRSVF